MIAIQLEKKDKNTNKQSKANKTSKWPVNQTTESTAGDYMPLCTNKFATEIRTKSKSP